MRLGESRGIPDRKSPQETKAKPKSEDGGGAETRRRFSVPSELGTAVGFPSALWGNDSGNGSSLPAPRRAKRTMPFPRAGVSPKARTGTG